MITNTHPVTDHRADLFTLIAVSEGFGKPTNRPGLPYFNAIGGATIDYEGKRLVSGIILRPSVACVKIA